MQPIEMKSIREMNSIILELPAISEASGKEGFGNILNYVLKDIYIDTPDELFDYMKYNLNDKMTETILSNYGIDSKYSKKVNSSIKRVLVFYLERLFQSKGSKKALGLFAEIFENFFSSINFYNIVVDKSWKSLTFDEDGNPTYKNGKFILNYRLDPIFINDKENILTEIDDDIKISNKYLMTLDQYEEYSLFPINTNLIYIQFSGGISAINNMSVFAEGIRAYGATYLQKFEIDYQTVINGKKGYLTITGSHLELLIKYFQLKEIQQRGENIYFESKKIFFTNLLFEEEYLETIEDVMHEYKIANYSDRQTMDALKRKWQTILRHGMQSEGSIKSFDELEQLLRSMYGPLIDEFLTALEEGPDAAVDIYMKLFTETITYVDTDNLFAQLYINTIFTQILTGDVFVENFFQPVFDIFVKYFFPVEMDYLNDFLNKMFIKDKWNTISTENKVNNYIEAKEFSLVTPQRGLDRFKIIFLFKADNDKTKLNSHITIDLQRTQKSSLYFKDYNFNSLHTGKENLLNVTDLNKINISKILKNFIDKNDKNTISIDIKPNSDSFQYFNSIVKNLLSLRKDKIYELSKQMLGLNSIYDSTAKTTDIVVSEIIQGDYNNVDLITNFDRYIFDKFIKYGKNEEFRRFELKQRYTYNKYMYLTTIDERL